MGSSTKLECTYDLEGENLYSVKWYKDGDEFFRYLPKSVPEIQVFEQQGIYIDVSFISILCVEWNLKLLHLWKYQQECRLCIRRKSRKLVAENYKNNEI